MHKIVRRNYQFFHLFRRNVNWKAIYKMPIAIKLLVGATLKEQAKKHIMFHLKVTSVGRDQVTELSPNEGEREWKQNISCLINTISGNSNICHEYHFLIQDKQDNLNTLSRKIHHENIIFTQNNRNAKQRVWGGFDIQSFFLKLEYANMK